MKKKKKNQISKDMFDSGLELIGQYNVQDFDDYALDDFLNKYGDELETKKLLELWQKIKKYEIEDRKNRDDKLVDDFSNRKTECIFELCQTVLRDFYIITTGEDKPEIFIYKDGVYVVGEKIIRKYVQDFLGNKSTRSVKDAVIDYIIDETYQKRQKLEVDSRYINLRNGIYDLEKEELLSHNPNYTFFNKVDVDYDPLATCPNIDNFMNEVLAKSDITTVLEWFGFCLYREYRIKKALMLIGEKNTGKTTMLNLLTEFLGSENISGVSLQKISKDRFASANLHGKLANIYDDLSSSDLRDVGPFKVATGGGRITGEHKYKNQFSFENFAKLIFSANKIPGVKEIDDDAYFSRWTVIPFIVETDKPDVNLIKKLSSNSEKSGLLNKALKSLKTLRVTQLFSGGCSVEEIKNKMITSSSSIALYVHERLEHTGLLEDVFRKDELYIDYVKFTKKHGTTTETKNSFGRNIIKFISIMDDSLANERVWRGVKFKNT